MSSRLCLVEDDGSIRELLSSRLSREGYHVTAFEKADVAWENVHNGERFDLYILDVLVPGELSGLDLCRRLRELSAEMPILILSALSEPSHRIEGLKEGADDYLAKPFEMEELLLRIEGMLRRRTWYGALPSDQAVFQWGENSVDFVKLEGRHGGQSFSMTQKEGMLMKLLVEKRNAVISRDEILDRVWGYNVFPSTRTVDNFILRLRKYFEENPGKPKYIHSVRGMGYKFTP